jgi:3-hydroxyisobutyrate dehydrogenase-like beta-hydroxyacid dehydrogenase
MSARMNTASGLVVAVLGLGEAGGIIAADLRAAGVRVNGYDPRPETAPNRASEADAVAGADIVLSLTTAEQAQAAATAARRALAPGQIYADANTSGATLKQRLASIVQDSGASFVDVALMAPVPVNGLRTPALASGSGAARLVALLEPLGMPIAVTGAAPGDAARRKLLRSIAWKGIAAVVGEALSGARAAGEEAWMRAELAALLPGADIDRMVQGSSTHARRRAHEMVDVCDQLRELGVEPRMSEAARAWLEDLQRQM